MTTLLRVQVEKTLNVGVDISGHDAGSAFVRTSDHTQREFLRGMLSGIEALNRTRLPEEQFWWDRQCHAVATMHGTGDGATLNAHEKKQIVRVLQALIDALDTTPEPADNDPEP